VHCGVVDKKAEKKSKNSPDLFHFFELNNRNNTSVIRKAYRKRVGKLKTSNYENE
jgi:hypothetical protein